MTESFRSLVARLREEEKALADPMYWMSARAADASRLLAFPSLLALAEAVCEYMDAETLAVEMAAREKVRACVEGTPGASFRAAADSAPNEVSTSEGREKAP